MRFRVAASIAIAATLICPPAAARPDSKTIVFSCAEQNDLYQCLVNGGSRPPRFDTPSEAVAQAPAGAGVLLLADGYPAARVRLDRATLDAARTKRLRLYVEFPDAPLAGVRFAEPRVANWERAVVAGEDLGARLPAGRILSAHNCTFLPLRRAAGDGPAARRPLVSIARVAGYDTAVYGLPRDASPLLFSTPDGDLVATTKLSGFVTGRWAPSAEWAALWEQILSRLAPDAPPRLVVQARVGATYAKDEPLPENAEQRALRRYANWLSAPGLMIPPQRREQLHDLLRRNVETTEPPAPDEPTGDGSLGILEGYASGVRPDGTQPRRTPIRADCHGEAAMVLALHGLLHDDPAARAAAANLLDFVYFKSNLHGGVRADPAHPAFGLIAWGDVSPTWLVASYGDDNARALLGTVLAAACLDSGKWDAAVLKALLANLRTTGRRGFRGDRIDFPDLARNGWRHYHDADTVNPAANFEAYPWACFLWAYRHTGEHEFLDKAKAGIGATMAAYPDGWRWGDNSERARMLLPLAWLVRVEDTPQHRRWLKTVAADLLKNQQPCGAIREHLGGAGKGAGHYVVPASNEAYGTTETPLLHANGDPVSDQLYTAGFALIGLHEAAAATGDEELANAADRIAGYLVRIQTHSPTLPSLDGSWFRAFDYERWECWASSADVGWGAWCVETGWGPAWIATTLGLRAKNTSFWDITAGSKIRGQLPAVSKQMRQNSGTPAVGSRAAP